jgi:hypothetical protein
MICGVNHSQIQPGNRDGIDDSNHEAVQHHSPGSRSPPRETSRNTARTLLAFNKPLRNGLTWRSSCGSAANCSTPIGLDFELESLPGVRYATPGSVVERLRRSQGLTILFLFLSSVISNSAIAQKQSGSGSRLGGYNNASASEQCS